VTGCRSYSHFVYNIQQVLFKKVYSELSEFFNFRYNISFIDPPLGGFGDISLSDDIFLGAKPLGKYHHFGKYYVESSSLWSINDKYLPT
jgi:hypothetical protein